MIRILCVSDMVDPIVYSARIKERFKDIDLVMSAGDLPMEYIGFITASLNKPLVFVFGNHNLSELPYYQRHSPIRQAFPALAEREPMGSHDFGATHAGFKVKTECGLIIAGLGGSMNYNKGPNQFSDFEMYLRVFSLIPRLFINKLIHGRYLDILLTHAPPAGIHDKSDCCHRGFKAFLWFMRAFKPSYLIHGHVHLYDLNEVRVSTYGDTRVVNAYSHYVIETELGLK